MQSNDVTLLRFFKFIENVDIEDCNRNFSNSGGTAKISGGGGSRLGWWSWATPSSPLVTPLVWSPDVTTFILISQKSPFLISSHFLIYSSNDGESERETERETEKQRVNTTGEWSNGYPRKDNSLASVHPELDDTERDDSKRSHSSYLRWTIWRWQR